MTGRRRSSRRRFLRAVGRPGGRRRPRRSRWSRARRALRHRRPLAVPVRAPRAPRAARSAADRAAPAGLGDRPPHQRGDGVRPGGDPARPIPTCSATRSWCCRAIARFALPPEADIARLRRHITYGGFLLIDSAEGRAGGGFDESVRRLLAQTLPGELPIRIPDSHVLWKSFYVLRGAPGRIVAAPLPGRGRARSPAGGRLHAERSGRRAGARRLRALGARGGPGRRRPARGGVPARRSTW